MAQSAYNEGIPDVLPQTQAPDDTQRIQANPSAFGEALAQGAQGFGQGATKAANYFGEVQTDDVVNSTMQQINDKLAAYKTLNGRDAMDAKQPLLDDIDALVKDSKGNLSTLQQQHSFDQTTRNYLNSFVFRQVNQQLDEQTKAYTRATNQASMETSYQGVAMDPENQSNVDMWREKARQGALRNVHDAGNESDPVIVKEAVRQADQGIVKTQVESLLEKNPVMAKQVLESNKTTMDPGVYDQLTSRLRAPVADGSVPEAISRARNGRAPIGPVDSGSVYNAIHGQESGGRSDASTSVTGATGGMQIQPATFAQYARPGENIRNPQDNLAVGRRITDDYYNRYGGDPQRVAVAYFSGPGNVAPAGSPTPWLRDKTDPTGKSVSSYVSDVSRRLGGVVPPLGQPSHLVAPRAGIGSDTVPTLLATAPSPTSPEAAQASSPPDQQLGLPDKGLAIQHAQDMANGDPVQAQANAAAVNRYYSEQKAANATERAKLESAIPDLTAAALAGVSGVSIPEDRIRATMEPAKAEHVIGQFNAAQQIGTMLRGVEWASPADVAETERDISSGQGVYSDLMRGHRNYATTGPGTVGSEPDVDAQADYFRMREAASKRMQIELQHRSAILAGPNADPASYVAANPTVRTAAQAIDPKDPASFENYSNTSLGLQGYLGVPTEQQHVLTRGEAQNVTNQLLSSADPKATMDNLQRQFGRAWPAVFNDATKLGGLPVTYQAVQALDDPHDAALLSRAIASEKPSADGKPGKAMDDVADIVAGKGAAGRIRDNVRQDPNLVSYVSSLRKSGASDEQIQGIVNSVETLALAKRSFGDTPDEAGSASTAVKSFFGNFDYMPNGGARVPTPAFEAVKVNAQDALDTLSEEKVAVPAQSFTGVGQSTANDYFNAIRGNPTWVTIGNGLQLMDQGGRFVRMKDGTPLRVPFDAPAVRKTDPGVLANR